MPRYYLHVRDGVDEMLDPDGCELPNMDAARKSALVGAREMLSADMKTGVLNLRYRIDIENEMGEIIDTVTFAEAFTCVTESDPPLFLAKTVMILG